MLPSSDSLFPRQHGRRRWLACLRGSFQNLHLRLSFIGYRDVSDGRKRFVVSSFQPDVSVFERALSSVKAMGGGDQCEDVVGALNEATKLDWMHSTQIWWYTRMGQPTQGAEMEVPVW